MRFKGCAWRIGAADPNALEDVDYYKGCLDKATMEWRLATGSGE